MRPRCLPPAARPPRRGAILLVVLAMLALFAVLGLSFVLYAESSATAARINREAMDIGSAGDGALDSRFDDDTFAAAAGQAVGQLLYDVSDTDAIAATSGLRGYGLVRLKYGQDRNAYATPFDPTTVVNPGLSPFAGQGLILDSDPDDGNNSPLAAPVGVMRSAIVNYSWLPGERFILDPEWTRFRQAAVAGQPTRNTDVATATTFTDGSRRYRNVAAAYTSPDLKDLPLAVVSAEAGTTTIPTPTPTNRNHDIGTVLQPSYFRYGPNGANPTPPNMPAWVFNPGQIDPLMRLAPPNTVIADPGPNSGQLPANDDWLIPAGRLKMIRPRPEDHVFDGKTDFPYVPMNADGTYTGDVMNLPASGVQRNDSLWMYPAGPVITVNNKQYTALVAPLVLDLGGRVNLSTAGNILTPASPPVPADHASNMGIGRWEVNPRWVFAPGATTRDLLIDSTNMYEGVTNSPTALNNLMTGSTFTAAGGQSPPVAGRYGNPGATIPPADPTTNLPAVAFNGAMAAGANPMANLLTPPHYSLVDFNGAGTVPGARPVGEQFSPFPRFDINRYYDDTNRSAELGNHPAQFNASMFASSGATGRTFAASDMRWLATRIAGRPEDFANADAARLMAQQLIAGGALPEPTPTNPNRKRDRYRTNQAPSGPQTLPAGSMSGSYNPDPYGRTTATTASPPANDPLGLIVTDPAMLTRMLVTTISNSTQRPELRVALPGGSGTVPLGPIDMTRPLPDYRAVTDPASPLSKWVPDNVFTASNLAHTDQIQKAQAARQRFARDIFVRLAAAYTEWQQGTGQTTTPVIDGTAVGYVNDKNAPDYGYLRIDSSLYATMPGTVQFQTLRQLAQLAVNIVDYIDPDDISTPFVWNLKVAGDPMLTYMGASGLQGITKPEVDKFIVFGTELPRLVVNEVYAAVQNDPADETAGTAPAQRPVETRFWVELHNPLLNQTNTTDPALSEGGSARLFYPQGTANETAGQPRDISVYQMLVVDSTAANDATTGITAQDNVLGKPTTMIQRQIGRSYHNDFQSAVAFTPHTEVNLVHPAKGQPGDATRTNQGFYVIGPNQDIPGAAAEQKAGLQITNPGTYTPPDPDPDTNLPPVKPEMAIKATGFDQTTDITPAAQKYYAVVLRRLANPYHEEQSDPTLPFYNPYVTVDVFDGVQPRDRAKYNETSTERPPTTLDSTASSGRRHPYAGIGTQPQTNGTGDPKTTLFAANDPKEAVFNWLTHLDRRPLNSLELASVSAVTPARLTSSFATPGPLPGGFTFNRHTAEKLLMPIPRQDAQGAVAEGGITRLVPGTPIVSGGELHQALDLLSVRSPVSTSAVGAPEAGRINLNAVNHPNVLRALFDPSPAGPNSANLFDESDVDGVAVAPPAPYDPTTVPVVPGFWQKLTGNPSDTPPVNVSRSPSHPNVSQDVARPDNPIWALGSGRTWSTAGNSTNRLQERLQQTVFRKHDDQGANSPTLFMNPLQNPTVRTSAATRAPTDYPSAAADHVLSKTEPLRKAWNNMATTSDTFLVLMTVAYFEVRHTDANGRVFLGKELHRDIPGDLRQKFAAVVDRSEAAVELNFDPSGTPSRAGNQDGAKPWFTVLSTDILPGAYNLTDTTTEDKAKPPFNPVTEPPYNPKPLTDTPPGNPLRCEIEARLAGATAVVGSSVPQKDQAAQTVVIDPAAPQGPPVIRIGFGDATLNGGEGENFTVTSVDPAPSGIPGRVMLTLQPNGLSNPANPTRVIRYHPAGSVVTNVLLGNPGPQSSFNPTDDRYKSVVRYFGKISP